MRALAFLGLLLTLPFGAEVSPSPFREPSGAATTSSPRSSPRLAQLGNSAAGLFLRLVNEQLQGRIDPRSVSFQAPATVILEDTVLSAPGNRPVARVKRALVSLSLKALLGGEIAISRLEIDEPQLLLEVKDGKLNLLEALTPKKKADPTKKAEGAFRIDEIFVRQGGFRLTDDENVTLVFDDINGRASLDVDLTREFVLVDVADVRVASGSVKLEALDVPLARIAAAKVRVFTDRVELSGVSGTALGGKDGEGRVTGTANFTANGRVYVKAPGRLDIKGKVEAAAGAWPSRLAGLDFVTPQASVEASVTGAFADPVITVNGSFGKVEPYGYVVDSGAANVTVTKASVVLKDGTRGNVGRGVVRATGEIKLPAADPKSGKSSDGVNLDLRVRLERAALQSVLAAAKLDTPQKGTLSGNVRITGPASAKNTDLLIAGDIAGKGIELYDLHLGSELDGDVRVRVSPTRVQLEKVTLQDPLGSLRASVKGDVDIKGESLQLALDIGVPDVGTVVKDLPADLKTKNTTFIGSVHGPWKDVVVDGDAVVASGIAWGVPCEDVRAHVEVKDSTVRVSRGTAQAASGALRQLAPLVFTTGKRGAFSSGTFVVDNADLAVITAPDGAALPLAGIIDVEAVLRGPLKNPRVLLRASAAGLVVADENLGEARAAFVATKDALTFERVDVKGAMLTAHATGLRLDTNSLRLTGAVDIDSLDLAGIENARSASLKGRAKGVLVIDGDVRVPTVQARLVATGLSVADFVFGDGRVVVGLAPDPAGGPRALVVTLAGTPSWDLGVWDIRLGYAIDRALLNADIKIRDLDLATLRPFLPKEGLVPLQGQINGTVTLSGPLDSLSGGIKLRIPDLIADVPGVAGAAGTSAAVRLRPFGPVFADLRLDAGNLSGKLCAFPDVAARVDNDAACDTPHRLWGLIAGRIEAKSGAISLLGDLALDAERIEELVPALYAREVGLSAWTRVALRYNKPASVDAAPSTTTTTTTTTTTAAPKAAESTLAVFAEIRDLIIRAPGAPVARVAQGFDLSWTDGRAVIGKTPARFVTARDDVELVIGAGSSVGSDDIDLSIEGQLALSVLKLVTSEVANAAGTAATMIKVTGRFDDGVRIDGSIKPEVGARLTLRSLGQPLVFEDGAISVTPDARDPRKIVVSFDTECLERRGSSCPLRAAFGEGHLALRGSTVVRTTKEDDEPWIERFDLAASGTGIDIKNSLGRAESNFDLALVGLAPEPVLSGRVEVADGFFKKNFQIRNFVLTQEPARPSTPLWQTLTPYGLGGLTFNVEASMQNVRVKARINAFSVDASLRGELRLGRSLKLPALDGAIEVEEGNVDFPRSRFEIIEMQVQFPTAVDGKINPLVHLAARAELQPGAVGNDVEVPIDLSLDGTFDLMQLDLTAVDPNRQWSRTELFAYVLFGTVPAANDGGFVNTGVDVASRAALRELAAPVSDELEQIAQSVGLDANIDLVSGWQLQLGRRLVLEGQGFQGLGATDSATSATSGNTNGTDALRGRLLIWDHLPVGKSLSFEGRLGTSSELRFSFRLFEE